MDEQSISASRRVLGDARSTAGWLARLSPRYALASLICFAASNALLIGLDSVGFPYWASLFVNAVILIPLGFWLQATLTFSVPLTWRAFGRYTLVFLPNTPLAFVILWLVHERLRLPMTIAAPIVTLLLVAWNFLGSVWALHRRSGTRASS